MILTIDNYPSAGGHAVVLVGYDDALIGFSESKENKDTA